MNKVEKILITGGSGFLGRNLAQSLSNSYEIYLFSRNQKNLQFAKSTLGSQVKIIPGDVSNFHSINESVLDVKPDIIIHAAATKFVGMSEQFPSECIDINILGSKNVALAAKFNKTKTVIGISTDKATSPIANLYGASKAVMERLYTNLDKESETNFVTVRYGNVAWSTGSVFPLWEEMSLKLKKVVTTGPQLNRFFFTIDDAVNLVRNAIDHSVQLRGKILSIPMKGVEISRLLDVWEKIYNIKWELGQARPGDRDQEFLIAENEVNCTRLIELSGKEHFLLDLTGDSKAKDLDKPYSSRGAKQFSDSEIFELLTNKSFL